MNPAVFVDKDGTLIEDIPYNVDPARITLCEGAGKALRLLSQARFVLVVVSNQSGIGRGLFPETDLVTVECRIRQLLRTSGVFLDGFYYCPHRPEDGCGCRKPRPGMLTVAAEELGLDLSRSWMMGDILDDVEAGHNAGCRAVLIDAGHETEWVTGANRLPDVMAENLLAAAEHILHVQARAIHLSEVNGI